MVDDFQVPGDIRHFNCQQNDKVTGTEPNAGFRIPRIAGPLLQKRKIMQFYREVARAEIVPCSQDKCLETDHN